VLRLLLTLAWLACVVYSTVPAFWLAVHPIADFWRTRRWNPFALLVPMWTVLWIVVAFISAPWRSLRFYDFPAAWVPATGLFIAGVWLYRKAGSSFSWSQLGGLPEVRESREPRLLAAAGIRAHVRHPIYLGHLLEMLAWSLGSGLLVCFGLTAIAIVTGAGMIVLEDRELEERFGEEYHRYKKNVPAIFPRRTPYNPNQT